MLYTGYLSQDLFNGKTDLLHENEKNRAKRILTDNDRRLFIECRLMLKLLLSKLLGVKTENIEIIEGVNGKPYLKLQDIFFNVSHSCDCFVIAITKLGQIGVDIEPRNRIVEYSKIKNILFSQGELKSFENLENDLRQQAILNLWTRKESFFKALGSGLTSPLKEVDVTFIPGSEPSIEKIGWKENEKDNWKMISLDFNEDYIGAISVQTRIENPILIKLTFENFNELNLLN